MISWPKLIQQWITEVFLNFQLEKLYKSYSLMVIEVVVVLGCYSLVSMQSLTHEAPRQRIKCLKKKALLLSSCSSTLYLAIQDSLVMLDLGFAALTSGPTHSSLPIELLQSLRQTLKPCTKSAA